MQAACLALKYRITPALSPEVLNDLGQNVFQILERDHHAGVKAVKFHPADVDRGAIAVAGVLGRGTVASAQLAHTVVGACQARHLDAVSLAPTLANTVLESVADFLEQLCGLGHKIGDRCGEVIEHIGVTGVNPDEGLINVIGVAQRGDRLDAVSLGGDKLQRVAVIEDFLEGTLLDIGG